MNPIIQGLGNARYRELLSKAAHQNFIHKIEIDSERLLTNRLGAFLINLGTQLNRRNSPKSTPREARWHPSRRVL